jgi:hypothetical protein
MPVRPPASRAAAFALAAVPVVRHEVEPPEVEVVVELSVEGHQQDIT